MIKVRMYEKGIVWVEAEVSGDAFTENDKIQVALTAAGIIKNRRDKSSLDEDEELKGWEKIARENLRIAHEWVQKQPENDGTYAGHNVIETICEIADMRKIQRDTLLSGMEAVRKAYDEGPLGDVPSIIEASLGKVKKRGE